MSTNPQIKREHCGQWGGVCGKMAWRGCAFQFLLLTPQTTPAIPESLTRKCSGIQTPKGHGKMSNHKTQWKDGSQLQDMEKGPSAQQGSESPVGLFVFFFFFPSSGMGRMASGCAVRDLQGLFVCILEAHLGNSRSQLGRAPLRLVLPAKSAVQFLFVS